MKEEEEVVRGRKEDEDHISRRRAGRVGCTDAMNAN